jgi:hypothetical protein
MANNPIFDAQMAAESSLRGLDYVEVFVAKIWEELGTDHTAEPNLAALQALLRTVREHSKRAEDLLKEYRGQSPEPDAPHRTLFTQRERVEAEEDAGASTVKALIDSQCETLAYLIGQVRKPGAHGIARLDAAVGALSRLKRARVIDLNGGSEGGR